MKKRMYLYGFILIVGLIFDYLGIFPLRSRAQATMQTVTTVTRNDRPRVTVLPVLTATAVLIPPSVTPSPTPSSTVESAMSDAGCGRELDFLPRNIPVAVGDVEVTWQNDGVVFDTPVGTYRIDARATRYTVSERIGRTWVEIPERFNGINQVVIVRISGYPHGLGVRLTEFGPMAGMTDEELPNLSCLYPQPEGVNLDKWKYPGITYRNAYRFAKEHEHAGSYTMASQDADRLVFAGRDGKTLYVLGVPDGYGVTIRYSRSFEWSVKNMRVAYSDNAASDLADWEKELVYDGIVYRQVGRDPLPDWIRIDVDPSATPAPTEESQPQQR